MTDLAFVSSHGTGGETDYIPGEVVRKLVAWSERDIEMLRAELELALKDAEAIEQRLALLDPRASQINPLNGHLTQSVDALAVTPMEAAGWSPPTDWRPQAELADSVTTAVSERTMAMPAVPAPTVSDPTIMVPVVSRPTT
jgi:hypothetical protein